VLLWRITRLGLLEKLDPDFERIRRSITAAVLA